MTTDFEGEPDDEEGAPRAARRDRRHESSAFVAEAVEYFLTLCGWPFVRVHPQEVLTVATPNGPRMRVRTQAARTPVESSLVRMLTRESRDPTLVGYELVLALPDTPRTRRAYSAAVAALPAGRNVTWLFVDRGGGVEMVPPPRGQAEAAGPAPMLDQSSTRSETAA